jgi:PilZ domain
MSHKDRDPAGGAPGSGPEPIWDPWVPGELRQRTPVRLPVLLEPVPDGDRQAGVVTNVSVRGVFVESPVLFATGSVLRLHLTLPLPGGAKALVLEARVRWLNESEDPRARRLPAGMGLEFITLDVRPRLDLEAFIRALQRRVPPVR